MKMYSKATLAIFAMIAAFGVLATVGSFVVPALADAPDKPSNHPGYNGLNTADEAVHGGAGFFSKGDVEFHTGTGQGGFCVSGVCPER
jgi:hypothetical protein